MTTNEYTVLPIPADPSKVAAFHDGDRWIRGIIPGTLQFGNGTLSCVIRWNGERRRITLALDCVTGYQESA